MFTGIIQEIGRIISVRPQGSTARLEIEAPTVCASASLGDSICSNGVCLTASELTSTSFFADLSGETLSRTTFSNAREGRRVNIEPALRPTDRLGGHFVAGHVDGIGSIISMDPVGGFVDLVVSFPLDLAPFIAEKGSVAIDGISLTVTTINDSRFGVAAVPYTIQETSLQVLQPGDPVNLEVDLLARYVQRLLKYNTENTGPITAEKLKEYGYSVE